MHLEGDVLLQLASCFLLACNAQDASELAAILNWLGFAWSRDRMKAVLQEAPTQHRTRKMFWKSASRAGVCVKLGSDLALA